MKKHGFLSALLAISLITCRSAQAQAPWTWLYPKPQGHNLYDVEFLTDQVAIAVGEGATIAITNDGGSTWSYSPKTNGLTSTLWQVAAIDANTAVAVGDNAVVLRTIDGGTTWTQPASGATSALSRVDFAGQSGIAVGSTGVRRSIDGGQTWMGVQTGFTVRDLDVVTPTLAFVVTTGGVLRSTDNGLTWSLTGLSTYIPSGSRIAFADHLNGVVATPSNYQNGQYYFTADGGQFWQPHNGPSATVPDGYSPNEIIMPNPSNLFVANSAGGCDPQGVSFSYGPLFRTANGADTWEENIAPRSLNGLDRNSSGTVLAVGEGGNVWRWETPATWQQIGGTQYDRYTFDGSIAFVNSSTGIATALNSNTCANPTQTLVFRTSNSGATWSSATLSGTVINDIAYAHGSNPAAYGVGYIKSDGIRYAAVFKSTDNGATWPVLWSSTLDPGVHAIDFSSATHGVAVGYNGNFIVLDHDVVTKGTIPGNPQFYDVAFADPLVAVAIGSRGGPTLSGVFRTTDGGATWSNIPFPENVYKAIAFASPIVGVAVGSEGTILRSADAGLTWQAVLSPTTEYLLHVAFSNSTYGMVSSADGSLLETTDGGLSWTSIPSPTPRALIDLVCLGPRHAYVIARDMSILEYRDINVPTLFASFKAVPRKFGAELGWDVSTDEKLASFSVLRTSGTDQRVIASSLPITARTFIDKDLAPAQSYQYQLLAIDQDGSYTQSPRVTVTVPPAVAELLPNQPNPFNPVTTIRFVVPDKMRVTISVHDVAGRVVATLLDDVREPGLHELTWNANGVASGVYFAKLRAGKTEVSRKMVLLK